MNDEVVLAEIRASQPRRLFGMAMLGVLGALLIYLALNSPPATQFWQVFLLAVGAVALWLAERFRRATSRHLEMTEDVLRDSSGRVLCRLDDIVSIDRGAFAFKPSNGFLIRLARPDTRVWEPGLWWRMGNRIGVGGVTPAAQSKFMAELIALRLKGQPLR